MSLTQKYRPQIFEDVIGQRIAVDTLTGLLDKKLPPTLLLCGPHAVGKTTLARILALRVNCSKPQGTNPCGKCESCKEEHHPDIHELNAAEERGIETIRRLQDISRLAPTFKKKIHILDECHALTPQAYQASLKLFEEPPKSAHFILVTTNPEKMPNTILSRCSMIRLKPISSAVLGKWLVKIAKKEGIALEEEQGTFLASASGGYPREALNMLEQLLALPSKKGVIKDLDRVMQKVTESAPHKTTLRFIQAVLKYDAKGAFGVAQETDQSSEQLLAAAVDMLQNLLLFSLDKSMVDTFQQQQLSTLGKVSYSGAGELLKIFGKYLYQAKTYLISADVALCLAVVDAIPPE
jgi:DNA polymerase-3 subunit gamma/tau